MRHFFVLILFVSVFSAVNIICAAEIRFKTAPVAVAGPVVTLGEIATISGDADEDLASLRDTLLFPAPLAGEERTVRLTELRDILSDLGVRGTRHEINGPQRITLVGCDDKPVAANAHGKTGNENQAIHRENNNRDSRNATHASAVKPNPLRQATKRALTAQDIRILESQLVAALKTYLDECMNAGAAQPSVRPWDIQLRLTSKQAQTLVDGGGIATIYGGKNPIVGSQQFEIETENADPESGDRASVLVDAEVALPIQMLVMRRAVPRGHLIGEADLALIDVLPSKMQSKDYLLDASRVIGRETLAPLREGATITETMVKLPAVVRKGEAIDVVAVCGSIKISVRGTAKNDAAIGETVQVDREYIDPDSKSRKKEIFTFSAVATDYGQAIVQAGPTRTK